MSGNEKSKESDGFRTVGIEDNQNDSSDHECDLQNSKATDTQVYNAPLRLVIAQWASLISKVSFSIIFPVALILLLVINDAFDFMLALLVLSLLTGIACAVVGYLCRRSTNPDEGVVVSPTIVSLGIWVDKGEHELDKALDFLSSASNIAMPVLGLIALFLAVVMGSVSLFGISLLILLESLFDTPYMEERKKAWIENFARRNQKNRATLSPDAHDETAKLMKSRNRHIGPNVAKGKNPAK